jgi:hypothetical protein
MTPQNINVNFQMGLDLKNDPFQLQVGKFLSLENMIFQTGMLLKKRPGYANISGAPLTSAYLTTLNGNLLAVGDTISAYSQSLEKFITKGTLQPCSVSVSPVIRNNIDQVQTDSQIANGLLCITYTQEYDSTPVYLFAVQDSVTEQNIVLPSAIPALGGGTISGSSRVFIVRNFFVIVSPVLIGGNTFLQYISVSIYNPNAISTPQNTTAEVYVPITSNPGWDGIVSGDKTTLVLAYNTTSAGQGVHVATLTATQIAANTESGVIFAFVGAQASILSIGVDATASPNIYYISYWSSVSTNGFVAGVYTGFGTITQQFAPVQIITATPISNMAAAAQNGSALVFSEVINAYPYDAAIPTHYINGITVSQLGVAGVQYTVIRSVGLASKAFLVDGVIYFLSAFQSPFQPSYFLINGSVCTEQSPVIVAKLAYQNGGGYLVLGLPGATVIGNVLSISYLYKQDVEALNTLNNPQQTTAGGIYSQLGINQVFIEIGTQTIDSAEIGQDLHLSGGFLSMFDGYFPVEHNFFVFPDSVEAVWSATGGAIAAQPDGITNIDAYYYIATYEWTDGKGNPFRSAPSIPVAVTTTGTGTTGSITIYVPTLRLTQKVFNVVKIVIYRWSVETEVYNQITSISTPILNNTTIDSITYVDTLPDADVVGNNILYTTGGVVPDTNGPATNIMTLFDTRLFEVDAEDTNVLWLSKTVIEGTPVEMSSDFTIYIAPNTGTVESTGGMTALFPMNDKLMIFKKEAIYYMNGTGPDNLGTTSAGCPLGNYSPPTFVTSVVGCTNQQSIVLTPDGLMFQSDKGIWSVNNALQTSYIGAPVEAYNGDTVTSANVVPGTNFVLFTLDTGMILMYDYYYGQWGTWVGLLPILSSCIYNGFHTLLTETPELYQQTSDSYLDGSNPVLMQFSTSWINLASLTGYQRFYEVFILGNFLSPNQMEVQIAYDYNSSLYHSSTITPQNFSPTIPGPFGIPTPFGSVSQILPWRIHAKQQLCTSFQVRLQEVFDPTYGTVAGAGFSLSGINCKVQLKKSIRPTRGANAVG